ncbi:Copine-5 [Basidiobolus ranarum]|uniref:Copine-5 n=1 Tax=Basidiobolus ranarum TaxID=34480 RepID=A0ABR2WPE3_9FUNG
MLEETKATNFELRVECQKLPKLDFFSESDPVVILSLKKDIRQAKWLEFGRTETIQDSPNPRFVNSFILHGDETHLRFDVFDVDSDSDKMDDHDYIGYFETSLQDILWSKNKTLTEDLINPERKSSGRIVLMVDEIVNTPENITFQFAVQNIEAQRNVFFFEINRPRKDGHLVVIYRSALCENSNIIWEPFTVSLGTLSNGDYYQDFAIQLFRFSKHGGKVHSNLCYNLYPKSPSMLDHKLIGTAKTSVIELKNNIDVTSRFLNIVGEWKENGIEDIGYLFVKECQIST